MGYRLGISKIENKFYGTKLYGYLDDWELQDLKSYKFMKEKKLIDEDEPFIAYSDIEFKIRGKDLKEFIKLYNEDLNNYKDIEKDWFINNEDIKNILENCKDWEPYIIDWS